MVSQILFHLFTLCFATLNVSAAATPDIVDNTGIDDLGGGQKPCKRISIRKEWRDLTNVNKIDYINAVKCLHDTRAFNQTLPEKFNRYDEFVYTHVRVANHIHGVGQFLPWHRHFGHLYETALRTQCHYEGPFPYWDWTRDTERSGLIAESPLFDTELGFGGDGIPGTYTPPTEDDGATWPLIPDAFKGCIETGPFAGTVLHVGPNVRFSDHCLNRNFDEARRLQLNATSVAHILSQTNYDDFWNSLDGLPFKPDFRLHDAGHAYLGGDMSSFYSSPNDPIFYLHHAGLDRLWWKWQNVELHTRLYQIGGRLNPFPPYGQTTLGTLLPFDGFAPSFRIRDSMDIRVEPYCYNYAD